jgi:hypothetical protein
MRQTVLRDGIAQRPHDMILAEHVGKSLGAVFAGKNLVTHPFRLTKRILEATGSLDFAPHALTFDRNLTS